jgi:hypothetical protein
MPIYSKLMKYKCIKWSRFEQPFSLDFFKFPQVFSFFWKIV